MSVVNSLVREFIRSFAGLRRLSLISWKKEEEENNPKRSLLDANNGKIRAVSGMKLQRDHRRRPALSQF